MPAKSTAREPADEHLNLFNTSAFIDVNLRAGARRLRIDHVDPSARLIGSLVGVVDGGEFVSGYSAPFGGVDLVRPSETSSNAIALVQHALDVLRVEGVRRVVIRSRPQSHARSVVAAEFALLSTGFSVSSVELNHSIDISRFPTAAAYVDSLQSPGRWRLNRSLAGGCEFAEAVTGEEWEAAYGVLAENRRLKGRHLQLSLAYVLSLRERVPGRMVMFLGSQGGEPRAAALVYRVSPRCALVVYWGDLPTDHQRSPMNALAMHVVDWAIANRLSVVDLGPSTAQGIPDDGLEQFKRSILALPELRLTFQLLIP